MKFSIKEASKYIVNLLCLLSVFPLWLAHRVVGRLDNKDSSFSAFSQFFSLFPGAIGVYLRKNFFRLAMTQCDRQCCIEFGTIFSHFDTEVGKGVYIGANCNIGKCKIEDNCTIGSNVHILSGSRQHFFDDLNTPIQEQGGVFKKIVIGEDSWIGNCALILANVGKKCIVGAGSVVTKDVEDYSIVAGNPARVIKKRK